MQKAALDDPAPASTKPAEKKPEPSTTTSTAKNAMAPNVAIVIYSMYGHIAKLAEAEKAGIEQAGGKATIYQCVSSC